MERTTTQPIEQHLREARSVLVALPKDPSTDALASGLALAHFLGKLEKPFELVADDARLQPRHAFLHGHKRLQAELSSSNQFVISVDIRQAPVQELSYELQGDTLKIFLSPEKGTLNEANVRSTRGLPQHSLIIVLGAHDLASLGALFERNADFFYGTPIINIDHHSANTRFGHTNLVEVTAASTAELVYDLVTSLRPEFLDEHMATHLFAGIMDATHGFRSPLVTPTTLATAGALLERGARHGDIVRNLFQSKSVNTLRLWGRVFARLQTEAEGRFVWSRLLSQDFAKAGGTENDIPPALHEVLSAFPDAHIAAVVYQTEHGLAAFLQARPSLDLLRIFRDLHPEQRVDGIHVAFADTQAEAAETKLRECARRHFLAQ